DKVEKYVGGLPDMIQGSVMASKPKEMHDAFEFATELMDQKIRTLAEHQIENKRNATTTTMVCVHQSATSATRLATWPMIARVLAMLTLVTTREPLGLIRRVPVDMNVVLRNIFKGNAQS
nr:reverse transcriptase domain-containing protein [Tanacetum cinerariifolium]